MKDTKRKYQEAIKRNIEYAKKHPKKYQGLKLHIAKMKIGIMKEDERYDDEITNIIKKSVKKEVKDEK